MQAPEKFDLLQMMAEIEDDIAAETADRDRQSDTSQKVISELVDSGYVKKPEAR